MMYFPDLPVSERLSKQLDFIVEIDKAKTVLRRTLVTDKSKQEDDAEHMWHLALMTMLLEEYAPEGTDFNKVLRMVLVHDLVEIYAGDTFAYDAAGNLDKEEREKKAADRLFAMLPEEQGREIRALWEEFDAMESKESRFSNSVDRLSPLMQNYMTDGHTWVLGKVTKAQVLHRMEPIRTSTPSLWPVVEYIIESGMRRGLIQK